MLVFVGHITAISLYQLLNLLKIGQRKIGLFFNFIFTVTKVNKTGSSNAITSTYSESVYVALGIQHAMRMRYIVICDLSGSTIFFHLISQTTLFSKKGY